MFDRKAHRILEILQTLIRIRTCENGGDELDAVHYISSLFDNFPVQKNVIHHGENRASLMISIDGEEFPGEKAAIVGHIDTLDPNNPSAWSHGPFSGFCEQGTVFGVGASNAKGGVASMLEAAIDILESGERPAHDLLLCFTADSVSKGIGAKSLVQGGYLSGVKEVVFCDPTGTNISVAQKGAIFLRIRIRGRSRHVMESGQATDALKVLSKFTDKLSARFKKVDAHPPLGECSVFLTQVATSGNAPWMIPENVTASVDIRTTPCIDNADALQIIHEAHKQVASSCPLAELEVEIVKNLQTIGISSEAPLVGRFRKLCSGLGREPQIVGQSFFTEAPYIVPSLGVPFITIGPGASACCDREDESVLLDDVIFVSRVYRDYMRGGFSQASEI